MEPSHLIKPALWILGRSLFKTEANPLVLAKIDRSERFKHTTSKDGFHVAHDVLHRRTCLIIAHLAEPPQYERDQARWWCRCLIQVRKYVRRREIRTAAAG